MTLEEFTTEIFDGIRELGIETQSDPKIHGNSHVKDLGYCKVIPVDIEFDHFMNAAAFAHEAGHRFGDSTISHVGESGTVTITMNAIIKGYVTI